MRGYQVSATLTNGSAVVSCAAAALLVNVYEGDELLLPNGTAWPVKSIDSNTQLTLEHAFAGTTGSYTCWISRRNDKWVSSAQLNLKYSQALEALLRGYTLMSSTSLAIGAGSKAFTTQGDAPILPGARVRASSNANPTTHWMEGVVTTYAGGVMALSVDVFAGSGSRADWSLNLAGARGAIGAAVSVPGSTTIDNIVTWGGSGGGSILDSGRKLSDYQRDIGYTAVPAGDGVRTRRNVSINSGSNSLTVAGAAFVAGDVGKKIVVPGAGAAGATLVATITARVSATDVTLDTTAGTTLSAVSTEVVYGADAAPMLLAAINALPASGGRIILGRGIYVLGATLELGDGTSTTVSTRRGIAIQGQGAAAILRDGEQPWEAASELVYAGAGGAGSAVVRVNGPFSGFAISQLGIDGSLKAERGLDIWSAGQGQTDYLAIRGCRQRAYSCDCYANEDYSGPVSANADLITGRNVVIYLPDVAHTLGLIFDGPADGSGSSCFIDITGVRIYAQSSQPSYGIYFRVADAVVIRNALMMHAGPAPEGAYGVVYDYTRSDIFPSGCVLDTPDIGWNLLPSRQFVSFGTPSPLARSNKIRDLTELNGCQYPVGRPNLDLDLPKVIGDRVALSGQTGAIGATEITELRVAGLYRINWYLKITTAGTAGTLQLLFGYYDPAVAGHVAGAPVTVTTLNDHQEGSTVIYSDSNMPLLYVVQATGLTAGALQYRLHISVERLA